MIKADDEFAFIVIVRSVGQEMIAVFVDEAWDLLDFLTGVGSQFVGSFHRLGAFLARHIGTGGVDGSHENRRRRSGVQDVQRFLNVGAAEHRRMRQKDGTLGEAPHGLVERSRGHVGPSRHGRKGAVLVFEIVVSAVGLVAKDGHVVGVREFDDLLEGAEGSELGRINDEHGFG